MGWLDGSVALVTGGGSGIGRGIVRQFVEEGARTAVLDRVPERVHQLSAEFGKAVVAISGDVTSLQDNKRAVEEALTAFGRLDVFVGNAGIFDQRVSFAELSESNLSEAFDELFAVNVKGCLLGAKAALPSLLETEGCMIFTASVAGFNSGGGGVLYTASKHAVVGVIRQLAAELAPRIRVNGVAPGGVQTDLRGLAALGQSDRTHWAAPGIQESLRASVPLQRLIQPEDIGAACVLLASREHGRAMTGVIINVDAGSSLRMAPQR